MFEGIRSTLDRDKNSWEEERRRRAEAGKLGGLAKSSNASNAKKNLAMPKPARKNVANVADNVNVTESVNVTETEKENTSLIPIVSSGADAPDITPKEENI